LIDYLRPEKPDDFREISVQGFAHIGDAVYELMVRTWLCVNGTSTAKNLHNKAVAFVSAKAQAVAAETIVSYLDEEEFSIYKRGRNTHLSSVPKGSTHEEYHAATGLEALFGYLYLRGEADRLNELFEIILTNLIGSDTSKNSLTIGRTVKNASGCNLPDSYQK
jgi:ribonuclease-3 family protein